jgi:hypothetical protein
VTSASTGPVRMPATLSVRAVTRWVDLAPSPVAGLIAGRRCRDSWAGIVGRHACPIPLSAAGSALSQGGAGHPPPSVVRPKELSHHGSGFGTMKAQLR